MIPRSIGDISLLLSGERVPQIDQDTGPYRSEGNRPEPGPSGTGSGLLRVHTERSRADRRAAGRDARGDGDAALRHRPAPRPGAQPAVAHQVQPGHQATPVFFATNPASRIASAIATMV